MNSQPLPLNLDSAASSSEHYFGSASNISDSDDSYFAFDQSSESQKIDEKAWKDRTSEILLVDWSFEIEENTAMIQMDES